MELFGELYSPDVFFSPIGSYYVMDENQAALATKLVKPKVVIPMHYDTFPVIKADTHQFEQLVAEKSPGTKVITIAPGESTDI